MLSLSECVFLKKIRNYNLTLKQYAVHSILCVCQFFLLQKEVFSHYIETVKRKKLSTKIVQNINKNKWYWSTK